MNLITVEKISKAYNEQKLFQEITFGIELGEKVSLVGRNGTGKSTLLSLIAGKELPDSGKIMINQQCRMEYLEQNPDLVPGLSVMEQIFYDGSPELDVVKEYTATSNDLEQNPNNQELQNKLQKLALKMERLQLWNIEEEVKSILNRLGIGEYHRMVDTLSGGEKRRLALARALIRPADLLLLDEPTNHLDLDTIQWLEKTLKKRKTAILMVTHDREFLNRVTDKILELDGTKIYAHLGKFSDYLKNKDDRLCTEQVMRKKEKALYRQELEWMKSGVRGRGTRQEARIERFRVLEEGLVQINDQELDMAFPMQRLGKKIIEMKHVGKSFGELQVLDDFSYLFNRYDRIGIVGKNGIGKSTLLKLLQGTVQPDTGHIIRGETLKIGYLSQQSEQLNDEITLYETVNQRWSYIKDSRGIEVTAAKWLERFLFPKEKQQSFVGQLSGGEKRRLAILLVLLEGPNVLLLDEPTNDLDLDTLLVLDAFLDDYPGVLLVVSHDRFFLNKNVDCIFEFLDGGQVKRYSGSFDAYMEKRQLEKPVAKKKTLDKSNGEKKNKISYGEKKRFEELEQIIPVLENEIGCLDAEMQGGNDDYAHLQDLHQKIEGKKASLENLYEEWTALAEKIEENA
ncbi:ABC-F family ATP-binding cassette domain-containing protein [Clostridia bacterium]|nr:ABC-F family ATP-binding cassette domain-containing protein [Clostridia bacterium]